VSPIAWLVAAAFFALLAIGVVIGCLIAAHHELERDEEREDYIRSLFDADRDLRERGVRG
jgi:hypothetical protein